MFVIQLSHCLPYCFSQLYIVIDGKLRKRVYFFLAKRKIHVVIIVYHITIERDFIYFFHIQSSSSWSTSTSSMSGNIYKLPYLWKRSA